MLRRPDIVFLDESFNAMDIVTEQQVLEMFEESLREATLFVVSHRGIGNIRCRDKILIRIMW